MNSYQDFTPNGNYGHAHARARINILIACEESQVECAAFRRYGFNAFSCDIQKCKGGAPQFHILGDVSPYLKGQTRFITQDGTLHHVDKWHLIIAHPPCTYLCRLSSIHLVKNGEIDLERYHKMELARSFFYQCLEASAPYVCVENPIPMKRVGLPRPTTSVNPFQFGEPWRKNTLLWLKNLPPLFPTIISAKRKEFVNSHRGKYRSRSFRGIADAMSRQWGDLLVADSMCSGESCVSVNF